MRRQDVVVDSTALVAALDPGHERHRAVRAVMERLLDAYVDSETVLVTHSDAVTAATRELGKSGVSAATASVAELTRPFEIVPLHGDLLRDARWVQETAAEHGVELPLDTALTIEVLRRRGSRRVVSLDPLLHLFDLERLLDGQSNPA